LSRSPDKKHLLRPSRSSPIFGSGSAETGRADEAQRVRNGARSHRLRPDRTTGNRREEGPRFRADAVRTPQLFVRSWFGRRYCDGTVYRVSVNGVDGANGAGQPANRGSNSGNGVRVSGQTGSGVSGNGGRFAGQPSQGGTVIGQPIWRRGGNGAGQPANRASNSGDGGRATGRRSRGGSCRRVRPEVAVEGIRAGFARSTGRKRASPAAPPSGENDGRCVGRDAG
jgi:hypothetical protein